ncbi:MAG: hypothetical protein WC310_01080 [Patescibacteria group bacterium]
MSNVERSEMPPLQNFEVQKIPIGNGYIYNIFFKSPEEAEQAIKDFWGNVQNAESIQRNIGSGTLQPLKHAITLGDRTEARDISKHPDSEKHPGMAVYVNFNGNTMALSQRGEEALRKLGYIE